MIELRDESLVIDEGVNEELENLQRRLDSICRREVVLRNLSSDEHERIMEEVEW